RGFGPRHAWTGESGRPQELRRRGVREAVAGDPGGGQAESRMDRGPRSAGAARFLRPPAQTAGARRGCCRLEGRGSEDDRRLVGVEGDVSASVSDAWIDGDVVRGG